MSTPPVPDTSQAPVSNTQATASDPQTTVSNPQSTVPSPQSTAYSHTQAQSSDRTPSASNPIALSSATDPSSPTSPVQAYNPAFTPVPSSPQGYSHPAPQQATGSAPNTTNVVIVGMGPGTQISITTDFNLTNYLRNPTQYISLEDYKDAYYGAADQILEVTEGKDFLDTITCGLMTRITKGYKTSLAKNITRLTYFLIQLLYPIIVAAVNGGDVTFNVVCGIFALIGFVYDGISTIWEIKKLLEERRKRKELEQEALEEKGSDKMADDEVHDKPADPEAILENPDTIATETSQPSDKGNGQSTNKKNTKEQEVKQKTTSRKILLNFAKDMAEEIIIYPSLICNLYSFINERGWEFGDALAVFDFLLTMISFFLDAILTKVNHIWLLYQLIRSTTKCQEKAGLYSYATPVNLMVPFSIGLAIAHTLMLCLIAVRIYADNFNTRDREEEPDEGDYSVTSYTSYMIFCGAYLPLMSAAAYIILNKHWFMQISWILYHKDEAVEQMNYLHITSMPTKVKLFGFMRDKHAYIVVTVFAPLFIAFYAGGYLTDYDSDELPKGAQSAASVLCTLFVIVFSIINIQAGIIFTIIIIVLLIIACIICSGEGKNEVRKRIRR